MSTAKSTRHIGRDEPIIDVRREPSLLLVPDDSSESAHPSTTLTSAPTGKRIFDLIAALILAIITLPLQLVGLAVSAIGFRAVPVFTQHRLGLDGDLFTFIKIRSLPATAPSEAAKYDLAAVENTRAGKFLRKTHLDELLQLWSVIKGDMSIVGPRPEMVGLSKTYDAEFVRQRTTVRPGITGLWQISAGSSGLIGQSPGYDIYYLRNQSWKLDLWIMARTIPKMLRGRTITFADLDEARVGRLSEQLALDELAL